MRTHNYQQLHHSSNQEIYPCLHVVPSTSWHRKWQNHPRAMTDGVRFCKGVLLENHINFGEKKQIGDCTFSAIEHHNF